MRLYLPPSLASTPKDSMTSKGWSYADARNQELQEFYKRKNREKEIGSFKAKEEAKVEKERTPSPLVVKTGADKEWEKDVRKIEDVNKLGTLIDSFLMDTLMRDPEALTAREKKIIENRVEVFREKVSSFDHHRLSDTDRKRLNNQLDRIHEGINLE